MQELYRAVDEVEYADIQTKRRFLPSPNGTEYKGFFFQEAGAKQFSDQEAATGGPRTTIVKALAPVALVAKSPQHIAAAEGRGVLIRNQDLQKVELQ
jgi:hypothetical protein